MFSRGVLLAAILLALATAGLGGAVEHAALDPERFPVPQNLHPNVDFWLDIFVKHTSDAVVIHDDRHLDVVFSIVDLSDLSADGVSPYVREREKRKRVRAELDAARQALRHLAAGRSVEELQSRFQRIPGLYESSLGSSASRSTYRDAVRRVRSQTGLRDRFAEALEISGLFMPGIERALAAEGVPTIVKCMPFVESMFNYRARSKVGASGAWQFTLATGKRYLQIDSAVDARSDVLLAARGAARMLARDYERVGSWPLALTGYNHGIAGMARAVRRLGTKDIGVIHDRYRSRTFGFASRNFYAEFVAAVIAYHDREKYFPGVEPMPEIRFDVFARARYVSLPELAKGADVSTERLVTLNPALEREVLAGTLLVPPEYPLRVPEGTASVFAAAYDALPADKKRDRQLVFGYQVRSGDTLSGIARRFGTSVRAIQTANRLTSPDRIAIGQRLRIPQSGGRSSRSASPSTPQPAPAQVASMQPASSAPETAAASEQAATELSSANAEPMFYTVRRGDTLAAIGRLYGITIAALAAHNQLDRPDQLRVGQRLEIPSAGLAGSYRTYRVRSGDTLGTIAQRFGTSIAALRRLNGLRGDLIRAGQALTVVVGGS